MRQIWIVLLLGIVWLACPAFAEEKKLFCVTTEEFPPFIGSQLKGNGWTMEIVRAVLEPQGYHVTLTLVPWARAVETSKDGDYDGLYLAYYTEERAQWYVYSEPVGEVKTGFFKLKTTDISFTTLEDLRPYRIGMTRGVAISPEFDQATDLCKEDVKDDILNIRKLLGGRVELVAAPELVFKELLLTRFSPEKSNQVEFMEPYLSIQKLYMAISKNAPNCQQKLEAKPWVPIVTNRRSCAVPRP